MTGSYDHASPAEQMRAIGSSSDCLLWHQELADRPTQRHPRSQVNPASRLRESHALPHGFVSGRCFDDGTNVAPESNGPEVSRSIEVLGEI